MNPRFHTDCSISDSLKSVRKTVLIYETIIVAKSFFLSEEFNNRKLSDEDYVETLYQTFMDRASDAEGKQYWVSNLKNGMSREKALEGFARSTEFSKIMKSFGL